MSPHVQSQSLRFVRISALAFVTQYLAMNGHIPGWWSLWSVAAGAAEVGIRQVYPTKPIRSVTSVLAPPPGVPGP